jgi:hypothetical protein
MKFSLTAAWCACLALLVLPAAGCSVSGNGLGSRLDASDGPVRSSDAKLDMTLDAYTAQLEANPDRSPVPAEAGLADLAPKDVTDTSPDRAPPLDSPSPGRDLGSEDASPTGDAPVAFEVEIAPDAIPSLDGNDEPLPAEPDAPATIAVDGPALDSVPLDAAPVDTVPPDLARADLAPDLPIRVDLARPDLPPPDLAPLPTSDWVVDNTTSIAGYTPTVMGTPTVTPMDAGTALCFDGTSDGLLFATNPIQGMQQFTIETLVYPEIAGAAQPRILHLGGPGANDARLVIQMRPDGATSWHLLVGFFWGTLSTTIEDTTAIHPSNQWYWLAVTYDGQTARLYVNGVLEKSTALTFGPMAAGSMSLAARQTAANFFPGCIRDVEFFNTALPAAELHAP